MSTVGSASATESHVGEADDARTTAGDRDEDMFSTGTKYREAGSVTSMAHDQDPMDKDLDALATRSLGGYDDRMSDDGSASLVGFGEGAGSTVSGPIYQRRPPPPPASAGPQLAWGLERTTSGLGGEPRRDRDIVMGDAGGGDTPMSASAIEESRDARMMDGVAAEPPRPPHAAAQDAFVDTTMRGPPQASARQPSRETAERTVQQHPDRGERGVGPGGGDQPGTIRFEGGERPDD